MDEATRKAVLAAMRSTWVGGPEGTLNGRAAELILASIEAAGFAVIKQKG